MTARDRTTRTVVRLALSRRDLQSATGASCGRDTHSRTRPRSPARAWESGLSLHGRGRRRTRHPLFRLRDRSGRRRFADNALAALKDRRAACWRTTGVIAWAPRFDAALALAVEVETWRARMWRACSASAPARSRRNGARARALITYGQRAHMSRETSVRGMAWRCSAAIVATVPE